MVGNQVLLVRNGLTSVRLKLYLRRGMSYEFKKRLVEIDHTYDPKEFDTE